ncbi:golgin subfamily A member 6-like protein 6 [Papaver somniferum]|uniref:golgin subfamily A member 6-like protein 6 n=1 Tax=Papaver somniferum TaxID=3469 RepID=UPI000E6FC1DB|nr:golgin subfamily A member 6-like protein 6 [Papaver somniferum]
MQDGNDVILDWLMKKSLMFVPNPALVIPGEKNFDAFTHQRMQLSSPDDVSESLEKNLGATSTSLLVDPPSSVAEMMVITDGYQYGYPQQCVLEIMRTEHFNNTLYQFFKAKAVNLEAKLRHREEELNAAELIIAARDKEILELKNRLKWKDQLGAEKENLCIEIALVRNELEKARKDASSSKVVDIRELSWLRNERTRQDYRIKELVEKIKKEADKWNARADEHNKFMAHYRQQQQLEVDMQNRYNADRQQFNETLERTQKGLDESRESIYRLETKIANLEEELRQARSSLDPEVQDYIQRFVREREEDVAEAYALSNALAASRADVARLVDSDKSLEIIM